MSRKRLLPAAAALLSLASLALAQPTLTLEDGIVRLSGLPPILEDERVFPELTKGLTTTFLFRVDMLPGRRGKDIGASRVEVRYELWDEIFHLSVVGVDGRQRPEQVDSMTALHAWWGNLSLPVLAIEASSPFLGRQARITLDVVPFSRAEESDTQRWFAESVRRAEIGSANTAAGIGSSDALEAGVFNLLIATSIRRRPFVSFDWTLDMPGPESR